MSIAPHLPTQLSKIGVTNVFYHGNHLTIESGRYYVSLEGSKISKSKNLKVKVTFSKLPAKFDLLVNSKPAKDYTVNKDSSITLTTDLARVRIEVLPSVIAE